MVEVANIAGRSVPTDQLPLAVSRLALSRGHVERSVPDARNFTPQLNNQTMGVKNIVFCTKSDLA